MWVVVVVMWLHAPNTKGVQVVGSYSSQEECSYFADDKLHMHGVLDAWCVEVGR